MSKNFFVYVLGSEMSTIFHTYIGWTNNLDFQMLYKTNVQLKFLRETSLKSKNNYILHV